jgi:predicted dehydrogenase
LVLADSTLGLALIGCGGMGLRHLRGLAELHRAQLSPFDLVAVCDARPEAAERAATLAMDLLGRRPAIFSSLDALLGDPAGRSVDAIDLVTDVGAHHTLGVQVLQQGKHLLCEKPLGLTVRACRLLIDAADAAGVVLATAENYRRDPMNRLVAALLHGGVIGRPFMAIQESVGGGRGVIITPWRHMKDRGGIVLDMGVHYSDLWLYFLGPIERVSGRGAIFEPLRYPAPAPDGGAVEAGVVQATAEDTSAGQVVFGSGAIGQWLLSLAGHGEGYFTRRFYGSEGSLIAPSDRTGHPVLFAASNATGGSRPLDEADVRALVPGFQLDDPTARLFGGPVLPSYELPFEEIDRKLLALELVDFGRAILDHRPPDVDGHAGLAAVATVYAFLESAQLGREVTLESVIDGTAAACQRDIDVALGLLGEGA